MKLTQELETIRDAVREMALAFHGLPINPKDEPSLEKRRALEKASSFLSTSSPLLEDGRETLSILYRLYYCRPRWHLYIYEGDPVTEAARMRAESALPNLREMVREETA